MCGLEFGGLKLFIKLNCSKGYIACGKRLLMYVHTINIDIYRDKCYFVRSCMLDILRDTRSVKVGNKGKKKIEMKNF